MSKALLLVVLAMPMIGFAADERANWPNCNADDQCVAVQGVCAPVAVHKDFVQDATVYYAEQKKTKKCVQQFWQPGLKDARAKCWQQRCQIVGK
jgi:hypothetical protein